jgi:drug/metabolite transporter (DMT)-like permease
VLVDTRVAVVGLSLTGALLAVYAALGLGLGMVSVVVPVYTSSPLFVLPLSALLLRDVERITWPKVLGAIAIVLSIALVSPY